MFAPDGIPSRPSGRLYRSSGGAGSVGSVGAVRMGSGRSGDVSGRSVVGVASGSGSGKRRGGCKSLGTLAKTAAAGKFGGNESFRKRTQKPLGADQCEVKCRYPPRRAKRTADDERAARLRKFALQNCAVSIPRDCRKPDGKPMLDRKSTRLNSSHTVISYAVFCLKKKKSIQPSI